MRKRYMVAALALAAIASPTIAGSAIAANVTRPYQNVDRRNDAGNDTGDSQVDRLNRAQLDENYWPQHRPAGPATGVPMPPPQPYYNR